jgi:putative flavoprotein involved in K+ transport
MTHGTLVRHFDTVVVGGGQAGLAVGYYLKGQGRDFTILDAGERVGRLEGALGLLEALHPGGAQRPSGDALPGFAWTIPHQGRGGPLPGGLRRQV